MKIEELEFLLRDAWNPDTCFIVDKENWSENNPSYGQSLVTSLAVNDFIGGKICKCDSSTGVYYYNVINDNETNKLNNENNNNNENNVINEININENNNKMIIDDININNNNNNNIFINNKINEINDNSNLNNNIINENNNNNNIDNIDNNNNSEDSYPTELEGEFEIDLTLYPTLSEIDYYGYNEIN